MANKRIQSEENKQTKNPTKNEEKKKTQPFVVEARHLVISDTCKYHNW